MTESEAEYLVAVDDMLSMDPSVMVAQAAEVPRKDQKDPWLARRYETFGASEAGPLLIALGHEHPEVPGYIRDTASRLFAVKAGLRKPKKAGGAADRGNEAERELVAEWNNDPLSGWPSVTHADGFPREFFPLLDRVERRMSWTPDGWCRLMGRLVVVEVKTDVKGLRTEPDWSWKWQVQQAMAVSGSACALILYGPGWAHWNESDRGKIIPWVVERDDHAIATLRHACAEGWKRVEEMRQGREEQSK